MSESKDLMDTLLFTLGVIVNNPPEQRLVIANAFWEAQELVASIESPDGDARPRILACFDQFNKLKAANDLGAAGWMLTAIQQRLTEQDIAGWEKLAAVADKAVELLSTPERRVH